MSRRRLLAALAAALLLAACGSSSSGGSPAEQSPVARVGRDTIPRSLFELRMASALAAIEQGGGPQSGSPGYDAMLTKLRASVLKSLIIDSVIAQEARFRHIAASEAEVETELQREAGAAGGTSALATQLAEAGGSLDQLRDAIRSRINEQRLENQFAEQRAAAILQQLQSGADFATLAKQLSDDDTSAPKGGDMGVMSDANLDAGDKTFAAAVRALKAGQTVSSPVRDVAGYEIIRVDAVSAAGWAVHRILVAAPQTYTVKERPAWFEQSLIDALAQYCSNNELKVMIAGAAQPCATPGPSGSASASPSTSAPSAASSPTP
jgi:parvulin-like peptidyl-prolyl isomerase